MDPDAVNYEADATVDDNSCRYNPPACTDFSISVSPTTINESESASLRWTVLSGYSVVGIDMADGRGVQTSASSPLNATYTTK